MNKLQRIYQIFDEVDHNLSKMSVDYNSSKLSEVLASLYSPGPSFQYVFDFGSRKFDFVSDSVQDILGYSSDQFTTQEFIDCIHNDDLQHFYKSEELAGNFLFTRIEKELIPRYKVSYQIKMVDKSGVSKLVLHQAVAIAFDLQGNLSKVLANHSVIDHLTKQNNYKVSFIDLYGKDSYFDIKSLDEVGDSKRIGNVHTPRELEIIRLLAEGFTSQEIAASLHISYDTVRTHRRNILEKSSCRNVVQLVGNYIKLGYV